MMTIFAIIKGVPKDPSDLKNTKTTEIDNLSAVMEALNSHLEEALAANGIHRITAYGWLDADTIDSEFAGHALWQTCPPCEADWQAIFDGGMPRHNPTTEQLALVTNGEDFTGATLIARQAIGMALCFNSSIDPSCISDDEFWYHVATSFLWLGIASDRIREYFFLGVFGKNREQYYRAFPGQKKENWAAPFAAASGRDEDERAMLGQLEQLAQVLQSFREERHHITHAVATRGANGVAATLRGQQDHATTLRPYPRPADVPFEEL
jgi:hypothetical protein